MKFLSNLETWIENFEIDALSIHSCYLMENYDDWSKILLKYIRKTYVTVNCLLHTERDYAKYLLQHYR